MKRLLLAGIVCLVSIIQTKAQTKKMYLYLETEWNTVMSEDGTRKWRPEIPYKQFVRLASEIFEVPANEPNDYYSYQFYEYIMKNYYDQFKKMKLHKDYMRIGVGDYDESNPNLVANYKGM